MFPLHVWTTFGTIVIVWTAGVVVVDLLGAI